MQQIHDFQITIAEYIKKGEENRFPHLDNCPICNSQVSPIPHGFYHRNVAFPLKSYRLPIRRYLCKSCRKTISILPAFLLPYYQYPLAAIMKRLEEYFNRKKVHIPFYRQLKEFYGRRFLRNVPTVTSFFRDTGEKVKFTGDKKEKAIKLLEMINVFPKTTFSRRYHNHFLKGFMAL